MVLFWWQCSAALASAQAYLWIYITWSVLSLSKWYNALSKSVVVRNSLFLGDAESKCGECKISESGLQSCPQVSSASLRSAVCHLLIPDTIRIIETRNLFVNGPSKPQSWVTLVFGLLCKERFQWMSSDTLLGLKMPPVVHWWLFSVTKQYQALMLSKRPGLN